MKPETMTFAAKHILIAEDDPDDQMLTSEAFDEHRISNCLTFVENGEELLDYLNRCGKYSDPQTSPRPDLILLDLNMPKKDGREALKEIKTNQSLKHIPVIVLTTSRADEDIISTYDLGVNSYITKPVTFEQLVCIVGTLKNFWLETAQLPSARLKA